MTKSEDQSKARRAPPASSSDRDAHRSKSDLFADRVGSPLLGDDVFARDTAVPPRPGAADAQAEASTEALRVTTSRAPADTAYAEDVFLRTTTRPERAGSVGSDAPTRPPSARGSASTCQVIESSPDATQPRLRAPDSAPDSAPPSSMSRSQSAQLLRFLDAQSDQAGSTPPTAGVRSRPPGEAGQPTIEEMRRRYALGDFSGALEAANAIDRAQPGTEARTTAESCREILTQMYSAKLGSPDRILRRVMADEELTWLMLDHRAGFMLSLIDGQSTVDEILDISGMSRLSALKILSELCDKHVLEGR